MKNYVNEEIMLNLCYSKISVLNCIINHTLYKGYPPTIREICSDIGLKSTSTVYSHLVSLERLGYIKRDPTKPRAIYVEPHIILDNYKYTTHKYMVNDSIDEDICSNNVGEDTINDIADIVKTCNSSDINTISHNSDADISSNSIDNINTTTLGERLYTARIYRNFTTAELANSLDITANTLRNYEKDFADPKLSTVSKISAILNVSLAYLVGLNDSIGDN